MNWKSTVLVSGPALLATWLFSTPPAAPTAAPAPTRTPRAGAVANIEREAARLETTHHGDASYRAPSRNPFRFAPLAPPPAAPAPRPVAPLAPVLPLAPPRPTIRLSGIASDGADGSVQRTAILTTGAELFLVKEGESAAGYRVTKIDDDAVELTSSDGAVTRLTFKP